MDVVVSGLGIISSIGIGKEEFWDAIKEGPLEHIQADKDVRLVRQFEPRGYLPDLSVRRMDKVTQFALVVSHLALQDAGIEIADLKKYKKTGVVFCTTHGAISFSRRFHQGLIQEGVQLGSPSLFSNSLFNTPLGEICKYFRIRYFGNTIVSGTTGGIEALEFAKDLIETGLLDLVLVVGSEEYDPIMSTAYSQMGMTEPEALEGRRYTRGFGHYPDKFLLGEGAAAVVLESRNAALKRNANIYGRIQATDYGYNKTIQKDFAKRSGGFRSESAIREAAAIIRNMLQKDQENQRKIDYILSGFNSLDNEGLNKGFEIFRSAFGSELEKIPVHTMKPLTGECFAAGSLMQAVAALLVLYHDTIPLGKGCEYGPQDGNSGVDADRFNEKKINAVLVHAINFDGTTGALVLDR
ncbi:MAG: beta-ketoacyl synthase N-terminal-like domain-containing protein [bacterium]